VAPVTARAGRMQPLAPPSSISSRRAAATSRCRAAGGSAVPCRVRC